MFSLLLGADDNVSAQPSVADVATGANASLVEQQCSSVKAK